MYFLVEQCSRSCIMVLKYCSTRNFKLLLNNVVMNLYSNAIQRAAQEREEKIQQWETFGVVSKPKNPKPKVGYAVKQHLLSLVCDVQVHDEYLD